MRYRRREGRTSVPTGVGAATAVVGALLVTQVVAEAGGESAARTRLAGGAPPVSVSLRTSWGAVPPLLEAIECIAAEEPQAFFPLLTSLLSESTSSHAAEAERLGVVALDDSKVPPAAAAALVVGAARDVGVFGSEEEEREVGGRDGREEIVQMRMALHLAAPRVRAAWNFYEQVRVGWGKEAGAGDVSEEEKETEGSEEGLKGIVCEEGTAWVDWYGEPLCDVEALLARAAHDTIDAGEQTGSTANLNTTYTRPRLLAFDHVLPDLKRPGGGDRPPRTAILYAPPGARNLRAMHAALVNLASGSSPRLEYVYRHAPPPSEAEAVEKKTYLSGYGVALDLKKTDYLAVDDRGRRADVDESSEQEYEGNDMEEDLILSMLSQYPENELDVSKPLSQDELQVIGMQATQLIAQSSNPLATLKTLSQNFPRYAGQLTRRITNFDQAIVDEMQVNWARVPAGASALWMNGRPVEAPGALTPFTLLAQVRAEMKLVGALRAAGPGLDAQKAVELLTHPKIAEAQAGDAFGPLFDASDRVEGGETIVWWNDIAKDKRYARWSPSLSGLLRQVYPGQFHSVRQNLVNVVLVMDLSKTTSLHFLAAPVNNIITRGFPIRFGVVPDVEGEEGLRMARLFYYLVDNFGRAKTMTFIAQVSQVQLPAELLPPVVDWDLVKTHFAELQRESESHVDLDAILNGELASEQLEQDGASSTEAREGENAAVGEEQPTEKASKVATSVRLERARAYSLRLDATASSFPGGHAFVNGKHFDLDDMFVRLLQNEMSSQIQVLQEKLYTGELSDDDAPTIDTYFYDRPGSHQRRNKYIFPSSTKVTAGPPGPKSQNGLGELRVVSLPVLYEETGFGPSGGAYLYPDENVAVLTTLVIADLNSEEGIAFVREAIRSQTAESKSRLTFIHNPASPTDEGRTSHVSSTMAHLVADGLLAKVTKEEIEVLLSPEAAFAENTERAQALFKDESALQQLLQDVENAAGGREARAYYEAACARVVRKLSLEPGEQALVVNGRVVGPVKPNDFIAADFVALEAYEYQQRTEPVVEALISLDMSVNEFDRVAYADLVSLAASVISAEQQPDPNEQGMFDSSRQPRRRTYLQLGGNATSFSVGDPSKALVHIGVLIDPLSEPAQKWSSLLEWISAIPTVYIQIYLNPRTYTEIPLKRFYRYNLAQKLAYDEEGNEIEAKAMFDNLPIEPIYTLAMDVPPSWLVRPRESQYDLDNIQLSMLLPEDRERGLSAIFELDYLVIEGHARDVATMAPPRGLQLQLTALDGTPLDDTQVVLNLGYLQFKAVPGVFRLELRPGRGRDIYDLESVGGEGWNSPDVSAVGDEITVASFDGLTLFPRLRRIPGMERADVLDEFVLGSQQPKGFLNDLTSRVMSLFKPKEPEYNSLAPRQADINIFTVASGLLYERFASIMILSVLRNTNSTVKFWFIENFLSPSFLEFLPHFAEAYNFEYELVTYKWPSWLRAQTEKQRIIWAYKILFLDVLFPMDLKKVIFVDADQIVRADLKELVDLDLHGAPYAYTPMGDDNVDMEGFRFWKTGYWKDFLQGRPYHISALYVVDLARFRQIAAGDILRGHYQQLSQDPNSLANLDQDLPNNLQREVPIYSLPEDWLWCETWCSKDRLHRAKTIDLCQNPLTKEPKLARARQYPEWEQYDAEIARLARTLADSGKIKSHTAAADVNALAGAGTAVKPDAPVEEPESESTDAEVKASDKSSKSDPEEIEMHIKDEL